MKFGDIRKRLVHCSAAFSEVHWLSSDSQRTTQRKGPLIAAPEQPRGEEQNRKPEQESGTGFGEEEHEAEYALGGVAEAIDGRIPELHSDRWRAGGNAAAEKSENGLLVPREEFAKGVCRTLGKREHELFIADVCISQGSMARRI